jgi:hypothetical protein
MIVDENEFFRQVTFDLWKSRFEFAMQRPYLSEIFMPATIH